MAYGPMVKELYHWESLWFIVSAPLNLIEIRKMRGNFARVLEGSLIRAWIYLICYFWLAENRHYYIIIVIIFQWSTDKQIKMERFFKPTPSHEKTNRDSREPADRLFPETTGRVVRSKSWSERMMAIIESTIPPPLPDETGWPGDPEKNLSAARVESAQLASQWPPRWKEWLGSGGSWSILQWSWIPNSALYDYWFRGRPARRMWQKRNSLFDAISTQVAQKCGWETWGMLKSKNQYVVAITTPLNHPHPKGGSWCCHLS